PPCSRCNSSCVALPVLTSFFSLLFLCSPFFFFFNDTAPTEIYTLSLHDALPILPYDTTGDDLVELFQSYGTVTSGQVIIDKFSGRSRGFGFVEMANDDEAQAAIEALNGTSYGNRPLTVNEARPREDRGRGGYGGGGGR